MLCYVRGDVVVTKLGSVAEIEGGVVLVVAAFRGCGSCSAY